MDKSDEYRAYAAECQRMADTSPQEQDKRQWLRLAQSWLALIRTRESMDAQRANASPQ